MKKFFVVLLTLPLGAFGQTSSLEKTTVLKTSSVPPASRPTMGIRLGPAFGTLVPYGSNTSPVLEVQGHPGWEAALRMSSPTFGRAGFELVLGLQQSAFNTTLSYHNQGKKQYRHRWLLGTLTFGCFFQVRPWLYAVVNLGPSIFRRTWLAPQGQPLQQGGLDEEPDFWVWRTGLRATLTRHWQLEGLFGTDINGIGVNIDRNTPLYARYMAGTLGLGYQF